MKDDSRNERDFYLDLYNGDAGAGYPAEDDQGGGRFALHATAPDLPGEADGETWHELVVDPPKRPGCFFLECAAPDDRLAMVDQDGLLHHQGGFPGSLWAHGSGEMDLADAALAGTALIGFGGKALAVIGKVVIGNPLSVAHWLASIALFAISAVWWWH